MIMNSPSAMSRLTSFTAGKPSPYCLTMLRISIEAMRSRPLAGWWIRGSALDRAVGQAGDDAPLEDEHEDDDRDGDDDRRRGDRPGRVLELRGTGEQAQRGGYRPRRLGRGQRDAVREVVPGDEEGDDRGGEDARGGQRDDHLAERLPGGRAVDLRGLLHLPGDLPEERRHRPDGDRQGQGEVGDDQPGPGVVEPDLPPQVEQRRHDRDHREDRHPECRRQDQLLTGEVQPGDRVGGEHRQDARDERRDQADAEGVPQRRQEEATGRTGEDRRVVLPGQRRRQERLVGDVRRRLERQRHDPGDREQRVEDDRDTGDDPPGLLPLGHQPSPLACARSIRKPLMKMNAMSTTERNSRTETAEPRPISTRAIVCRYARNETDSVPLAPAVMMKIESKMRNASSVRNSRATMIAAFMFGMVTRHIRCHQLAPSTLAASCSTSGTCARPARMSSEMKGVVFQISARQITRSEVHWPPNQSVSAEIPGSQANQLFTKPVSIRNANVQAKAETTVMTAYGMRIAARTTGRMELSALAMTSARAKPRTSSTTTVTSSMTKKAGPASSQPSRRSARERSLMVPRGAETGWVFSVGGSVVVLIAAGLLTGRPGSGPGPAHRSPASPTTAGGTRAGWLRRPRCSTASADGWPPPPATPGSWEPSGRPPAPRGRRTPRRKRRGCRWWSCCTSGSHRW